METADWALRCDRELTERGSGSVGDATIGSFCPADGGSISELPRAAIGCGLAPLGRATRLFRRCARYSANCSFDMYTGPGGVTLRVRSLDLPRSIVKGG